MTEKDREYERMTEKASPKSPKAKNIICSFLIGGIICTLGECFKQIYAYVGINEETVKSLVSVTLIVLTAILTGIGIFDKIAKHAGAGTLVPITGFANAVVSSALEYNTEGMIFGTAAKMFTIAGPVIVYGCGAASLYGLIYYCFLM
ncbi:MAG: stage V sporulation protein AC [Clostridiales bacterium]|nr:stage V sporulation protein AC [Clostridiales bacterium]